MSDSFKNILRTKTAEQLSNMFRNKESWSDKEHKMIQEEVQNRGLEIFEEPEEWSDEVMENVDLVNPTTEFEKNMAFIAKENVIQENEKGLRLASQIVSVSSVFVGFGFLYWYDQMTISFGITSTYQLCMTAILVGIVGLILFILKKYLPSLVVSSVSLAITLVALFMNLQALM